jgi:hypothetical protein
MKKVLLLISGVYFSPEDCNTANFPHSRRYKDRNILPIGENQIFVFMAQDMTIHPCDCPQFEN